MTRKQNKGNKNSPRRSRAFTPFPEELAQTSQTQPSNNRISEALRNLQDRVPDLRVPNYIDIVDDNENREPASPVRNAINTPIDPVEG